MNSPESPKSKDSAEHTVTSARSLKEPLLGMAEIYDEEKLDHAESESAEKAKAILRPRNNKSISTSLTTSELLSGRNYANNAPKIFLETITAKT